jgi:hypothetical protein
MKGDVKRNTSPPTGRPERRDLVAASHRSVETSFESGFLNFDRSSQRGAVFRKLKSERAVLLSTIVLFEPRGLVLFQIVREGIEFIMGLRRVAVVHR